MDGNAIQNSTLQPEGIMNAQGMQSGATLGNNLDQPYGSEYPDGQSNQPLSPSFKSLMKAKNH